MNTCTIRKTSWEVRAIEPITKVGNLRLVHSMWAQITENNHLDAQFPDSPLHLIIKLEEFSATGDLKLEVEEGADKKSITLKVYHGKRISIGGYGSIKPLGMGQVNGKPIFVSYYFTQIGEAVNALIAFYVQESDG